MIPCMVGSKRAGHDSNKAASDVDCAGVGFGAMLDQPEADGKCSGKYLDGNWPGESRNRLFKGQQDLEAPITTTVEWLKKQEVEDAKDPLQETLLEWLNKKGTTAKGVLPPELLRRGIGTSGVKAALATKINDHAKQNPGGFKNCDKNSSSVAFMADSPARPVGFLGVMPS